ncbi:MAG: hypothetical protein SRB1_01364 [Desulfobacteraceae bacterium Eth-SRB1]|nr:MAG: hypothetical protein SRB1_01364 [Desulfobacteraceae bacterium Eth-SRB1]
MNADRFKYKKITKEGELLKIEDLWNRFALFLFKN